MNSESLSFDDTIAAIATPLGTGGLGVVRLSGPRALAAAQLLFRSDQPLSATPSHTIRHGFILEDGSPADEALAAVFRAPRSYTGEDVVELSCHGGALLVKRVLELCLRAGARLAAPGEFTRRAFLNGKLDLAQAEAVADLIAAQSDALRRIAADQLQGGLSRYLDGVRARLLDLLAHVEAGLDFVDDEVPPLSRAELSARLDGLLADCRALLATAPRGRLLREGVRAVIVGKPNVGKSSLFNALLGSDRAIVTDVPGTTRDTLEERIVVGGLPVVLTDTAGLRAGAGRVETEGIARARRALDQADLAVFVLDASAPPEAEDRRVADLLAGKRVVVALNKSDAARPDGPDLEPRFADVIPHDGAHRPRCVLTSAVSGRGLDDLRDALSATPLDGVEAGPAPTLVNVRHEALLRGAVDALDSARGDAAAGATEECLTVPLRAALDRVNEIAGRGVDDDVLDAIFSKFCIGK